MMKKIITLVVACCVFPLSGICAEDVTWTGSFVWSKRNKDTHQIKAVFTPDGENKWKVSFHFEFRDKDHVYSGTAEGSLAAGELKGEIFSDDKNKRKFTFKGDVKEGAFSGTHEEIRGWRKDKPKVRDTGTMRLSPAK
jgi:hypothetical protein